LGNDIPVASRSGGLPTQKAETPQPQTTKVDCQKFDWVQLTDPSALTCFSSVAQVFQALPDWTRPYCVLLRTSRSRQAASLEGVWSGVMFQKRLQGIIPAVVHVGGRSGQGTEGRDFKRAECLALLLALEAAALGTTRCWRRSQGALAMELGSKIGQDAESTATVDRTQ